jgi:hypothetical protein
MTKEPTDVVRDVSISFGEPDARKEYGSCTVRRSGGYVSDEDDRDIN